MSRPLIPELRFPEFKDAPPWEMKRLGEVGSFQRGSGIAKSEAQSGDLPAIRYGELYTTHHNTIRRFTSRISPEVAATAQKITSGILS